MPVADKNPNYINHPYLKKDVINFRAYQVNIAKIASEQNTLVVLPTALGKTIVALLTLIKIIVKAPKSKILILAPTRPLVIQHFETFKKFLNPKIRCCLISSNLSPVKRAYSLNNNEIFFSTPQIIQNDLKSQLYNLKGFSQIIFDESHKARKKYAYTYVARSYFEQCTHPLTLALTASPGKDLFRINDLCQTLKIEEVIFRNSESDDVKDYVYATEEIIHEIEIPEKIFKAQLILDSLIRKLMDYFYKHDIFPKRNFTSKFQFIQLMQDLKILDVLLDEYLTEDDKDRYNISGYNLNFPHLLEIFNKKNTNNDKERVNVSQEAVLSKAIQGIYLEHLKEILTTQSPLMFFNYLKKLEMRAQKGQKKVSSLLNSKPINKIIQLLKNSPINPKISYIKKCITNELKNNHNAKLIIFVKYREMGQYLEKQINRFNQIEGIKPHSKRFVGQSTRTSEDKGMNQDEQQQIIKDFSNGKFNILIATSVAEEGLDIPNVDCVIFYDTVPSEIRLIQRRGRTGRHRPGKCYYLVNKNTLDEIYYYVSQKREQKMEDLLQSPHLINTQHDLERSREHPKYKEQSIIEIENKYKEFKELKSLASEENIRDMLENHSMKVKNTVPKNKPFMVNDFTSKLTKDALERTKKQKANNSKKKKYSGKTKKFYNWIIDTMNCLGSTKSGYIYCILDEIYSAAKEEGIQLEKIDVEIDQAIKQNAFQTKKDYLVYRI